MAKTKMETRYLQGGSQRGMDGANSRVGGGCYRSIVLHGGNAVPENSPLARFEQFALI